MTSGPHEPDPLEGLIVRMNERRCTGILLNGKKLGFVQRVEMGPVSLKNQPDVTLVFTKYRVDSDQIVGDVMEADTSNAEIGSEEVIGLLSRSAPWVKIKREFPLISFHKGQSGPHDGIWAVLNFSDEVLEEAHDWVQWVFPNREPSAYVDAPLLNDEIVQELKEPIYLTAILAAYARFCGFLHLKDETPHWMTPGNHNFRRITRVLKFLIEINQRNLAEVLHSEVVKASERNPGVVTEVTMNYWARAVRS